MIVGRLIPAGTGGMLNRLQKVAVHRDDLIVSERERMAKEQRGPDPLGLPSGENVQAAE